MVSKDTSSALLIELFKKLEVGSGDIAFFCGAGISRDSSLPTAFELKYEILTNLKINDANAQKIMHSNVPFESFMETLAQNLQIEDLLSIFTNAEPNNNHLILAGSVLKNISSLIVTTNFDTCIEKAFHSIGLYSPGDFKVLSQENEFKEFDKFSGQARVTLVKIHGSVDIPNSIRTTLASVSQKENSDARRKIIEHTFLSGPHRVVVVLGYSCSDLFDIVPSIENIRSSEKEVLFVQHSDRGEFRIEDISISSENNPFRLFKGYRLIVDTKIFMKKLNEHFSIESKLSELEKNSFWKERIKKVLKAYFNLNFDTQFLMSGQLMELVSDHRTAVSYYQKAINSARQQNKLPNVARVLSHLGNALAAIGSIDKALDRHNECLDLCKTYGDELGAFYSRSNLIRILNNIGDTQKAMELTAENYKFATKSNDKNLLSNASFEEGQMDLVLGYYEDAIDKLEQCKKICFETGNIALLTNALGTLGNIYMDTGDYESALISFNETLNWSEKIGNSAIVAQCYGSIGSIEIIKGNYNDAKSYFETEMEYARISNLPPLMSQALMGIGSCHSISGALAKALASYEEALRINKRLGDADATAKTYGQLSDIYRNMGEIEKALELLEKGINELLKTKNISTMTWLLVNKGLLLEKLGKSHEADKFFHYAVDLVNKNGNKRLTAMIYFSAYDLAVKLGNPKVGLEFASKYLEFIKGKGNVLAEGNAYSKIAFCYGQLNDYERSTFNYYKSLEIGKSQVDLNLTIDSLNGLSVCYQETKKFDKAEDLLNEGLEIALASNHKGAESGCYTNFSRMYYLLGKFDRGLFYAEKAYKLSEEIGFNNNICMSGLNAGMCLKEMGRKEEADIYFEKVKQLSIGLGNLDYLNRLRKSYDEKDLTDYLKSELTKGNRN